MYVCMYVCMYLLYARMYAICMYAWLACMLHVYASVYNLFVCMHSHHEDGRRNELTQLTKPGYVKRQEINSLWPARPNKVTGLRAG